MPSPDLVVHNGTLLTMDSELGVIEGAAVLVRDGVITGIETGWSPVSGDDCAVLDARGGIIMPGLINSHTHAAMTLFRGMADDLPLMDWLNKHILPAESRLTGAWVYQGALLACAEMILSGTTCFCDMYPFEDHVARAADEAGMRAVVGEALYDFPSPNYGSLDKGFDFIETLAETWNGHPRIRVSVQPHSAYLCSPDLLVRAGDTARRLDCPLVIHVAETLDELETIKKAHGTSPVGLLERLDLLGPGLVACHGIHLSAEDIALLKARDARVVHCPESNMKLASGVAQVPELLRQGVCVALGTDGCASNNDLDLLLEMDTAAKLHKVFTRDPEVMKAETVLKMATVNGAKALGLERVTGSVTPGKRADLIVVDTTKPHMTPMYNPYSHLVYSASGSDVSAVVIEGRLVMKDRQVLTLDVKEIMTEVRHIARSLAG